MVDVPSGKMVWTGNGDQLEDHPGKNVQHWTERSVHKGINGTATAERLFLLCQDVSGWKISPFAHGPWVRSAGLLKKLIDQIRCDARWRGRNGSKDLRIQEGLFNGLVVQAWAKNAKRRGMFVFAVEDSARENCSNFLMEERVMWLVRWEVWDDQSVSLRSWIMCLGMDGRPLNLHHWVRPRVRSCRNSLC